MYPDLAEPSAQQPPEATVLSIPGNDALYGCVDWFFYQPPPGKPVASADSPPALTPARAELALSY